MAYTTVPANCRDCDQNARKARKILTFDMFAEDWNEGIPTSQIAEKYGVHVVTIYNAARAAGAKRKRVQPKSPTSESRAQQMIDAYSAGLSLKKIGEIHGVTRERVRQIISARGITRLDGGIAINSAARKVARSARIIARRDEQCIRVYGCIYSSLETLLGVGVRLTSNKATKAYVQHRKNSAFRDIEFSLTFPQWWAVWQKSGKWEERGRGNGYVMARKGDNGSYSVGNVYICTQSQNVKDGYIKTPSHIRTAKAKANPNRKSRLGHGRGWTYDKKCTLRPYQVMVGSTRIGNFATEQEARAAYLQECEKRIHEAKMLIARI
jgi:transposase